MAGFFDQPKMQSTPIINPADTQNRMDGALARRLQSGGTNSTLLSSYMQNASGNSAGKQPTLTGVN